MDVGSFPKRQDREGMPRRAYMDVFTASFELNTILYVIPTLLIYKTKSKRHFKICG